jgi:RNA polymerase sigma-70 factor (ECF subfamily)
MPSDEELIKKYLKGDEKSLEVLIKRYLKPIYSFAFNFVLNQQDAEDLTQEIFLKMWRNLKKFNRNKNLAPYRTEGSGSGFKNWLFIIAKNTCFDFLRKKRKNLILNAENLEIVADLAPSLLEKLEKESLLEKLKKEIEKLPFKMKEVIDLHYNFGLNFREISEILREPVNTVKSRHKRAISKLKRSILR